MNDPHFRRAAQTTNLLGLLALIARLIAWMLDWID